MLPQAAFLLEQRIQRQHWHLGTRRAGKTSHTLHDHNGKKKKKKTTTVLAFALFVHIFLATDATYPEIP